MFETSERAEWYAVWTRSRHEKLVQDQLARRGLEPFLPLWSRWSQWKDRRKLVAMPLFPQYCFVRFHPAQKLHVLRTPGVISILGTGGVIEPVRESEVEAIQSLVNGPLPYDPCPFLEEGMEVEVVRGPLKGVQGRLIRKNRSSRLVLAVTLIRQGASVEIDAADVVAL